MSIVHSFVEDSVWDRRDMKREKIVPAVFRLQVGDFDVTFTSDFGLFYDPNDEQLIDVLTGAFPGYDWGGFVFWKHEDRAEITLIDPHSEKEVGKISIRANEDPGVIVDMTNVVSIAEWKAKRDVAD